MISNLIRLTSGVRVSAWQLALAAALFIVFANNRLLLDGLVSRLDLTSLAGISFLLLILLLMGSILVALMLSIGVGPLLKPVVALLLLLSALFGYFVNTLGVVFDQDMFVNVADTMIEGNVAEATELLSWSLLRHVLLLGALPAFAISLLKVRRISPLVEMRNRAAVLAVCISLVASLGALNYRYTTYFAVENRDLRLQIVPIFPLISAVKMARHSLQDTSEFTTLGADSQQAKTSGRRTVGIMVVGETARADHFSLFDYPRETNPRLSERGGLVSLDSHSCGTSTAYSVPCMFFLRGHDEYSPDAARSESNVLDLLNVAGVETVWIDNNSTCKHVCDRIENANLRLQVDGTMQFDGDYDETLLDATKNILDEEGPDLLIVLHMMGSHGPAYSRRYPAGFATFKPYCHALSPTECATAEVMNAYDNSILYTDFVLDELISMLQQKNNVDSFLFYASDHGESLGENGVYLHGLPYRLAPESQKEVPMLVWLSENYQRGHEVNILDPSIQLPTHRSHDAISHTLLGLYDVASDWYQPERDIFAAAKAPQPFETVTVNTLDPEFSSSLRQ